MPLEPGQAATVERVVTRELTADALGNLGVTVLATPSVIDLLEHAAHAVMVPHLAPGAATVGTGVHVRHLAATPPGMRLRAKAVLRETDGRRCVFDVDHGTSWRRSRRGGTSGSWCRTSPASSAAPSAKQSWPRR
jgi:predicted thioesterase